MQQQLIKVSHQVQLHQNILIATQMHITILVVIKVQVKRKKNVVKNVVINIVLKAEKIIIAYVAIVKCLDMAVLQLPLFLKIILKCVSV